MSYVELHSHSAFSFLDGASSPDELALRAAELGHREMALTDHDGLWGSMEFAQACHAQGVRPITGAELTVLADGAPPPPAGFRGNCPPGAFHLTLLVADATGYRNLCRLLTRAHAGTREEARPDPAGGPPRRRRAPRRGPRLPLRLRPRRGAGRPDRPRRPRRRRARSDGRCSAPSAPIASGSSCSVPLLARRPGPQPPARRARRAARRALRRHRQRPRPRSRPHPPPGRARRGPARRHARVDRAGPPRQRRRDARRPRAGGGALPRAPGSGRRDGAPGRAAALRPRPPTSATATRARRTAAPTAGWPRSAGRGSASATTARRQRAEAERRLEQELNLIAGLGALGLLPAPPRPARARPRGRGRGARPRQRPLAAAAGPRPRLERQLGRLLPDRALPRRPGRAPASSSAASSTRRSPRRPTSTSTSRATSASG